MSEASEVRRLGAKAQPNSGRGKHKKSDAILGPFVYDIKEYAKSFSVSRDVWAKVCSDTITVDMHMQPALQLVLGDPPIRLWVIEEGMFLEMLEAWEWKKSQ